MFMPTRSPKQQNGDPRLATGNAAFCHRIASLAGTDDWYRTQRRNPLPDHPWLEKIARLPGWLVLLPGLVWLIADQWPDGWRDRLTRTRIIKTDQNPRSGLPTEQPAD